MTIRLRGHHLLCLLGYRGMGYSADFCTNMTVIYETLRTEPDSIVELVSGPDDICRAYPPDKSNHCSGTVYQLDDAVLEKLGLTFGAKSSWRDICATVALKVVPDDIGHLCTSCPWQSYGVCQEGVRMVAEGKPLPAVSSEQSSSSN